MYEDDYNRNTGRTLPKDYLPSTSYYFFFLPPRKVNLITLGEIQGEVAKATDNV